MGYTFRQTRHIRDTCHLWAVLRLEIIPASEANMFADKRALLVESDADAASMVSVLLQEEGYEVAVKPDGLKAFRECTRGNYDLVVLGVAQRGWNGKELLNSLALFEDAAPVVVVTNQMPNEVRDGLEHQHVLAVLPRATFDPPAFKLVVREAGRVRATQKIRKMSA